MPALRNTAAANVPQPQAQKNYWIMTIPEADFAKPTTLPANVTWMKGQLELGAGGFRHWQLVCHFTKKVRLGGAKLVFGNTAHCEPTLCPAANDYVWKEETAIEPSVNRFELGERPIKRNDPDDWKKIAKLAKEGKVDEIEEADAQIFMVHYRTIKLIAKDYMKKAEDLDSVCGVWMWGPPRMGKSTKVRSDYPGAYNKTPDKWFDGYQNEDFVIFDDFDPDTAKQHNMVRHMKIWTDKFAFTASVKGSAIAIRPKKFVITSNYSIEECFPNARDAQAIRERCQVIHCPMKLYGNPLPAPMLITPAPLPPVDTDDFEMWSELGFTITQ